MKNKVLIIALGIMVNTGLFAQGYPVIDITAIIASIENGYTMVQQLQAMYNNLKTSYDQLQQQIKSFESFDLKTLDARDPLGSWQSINTYADRMKAYEQNIESIINRKDIKIGSGSYSLKDVFTSPTATIENMKNGGINYLFDPMETHLSPLEKMEFHMQNGISFGNLARIQELGATLQKKAAEVVGYSGSLAKNLAEDREKLDELVKGVFGSESIIQQQQINNAVLTVMAQDMKTQANLLGGIAHQLATNMAQTVLEKNAMKAELNINDLNLPEGLTKMLDEMQQSSAYR